MKSLCLFYIGFMIFLGSLAIADAVKNAGRFQPVTPNTALDTRHGVLCYSYDPLPITNPGRTPLFQLCKDIK